MAIETLRKSHWRTLLAVAALADAAILLAAPLLARNEPLGRGSDRESLRERKCGSSVFEGAELDLEKGTNGPLVLALDLDGTLLNSQHKVSERAKRAIWRFRARGGAVVLATGQPWALARSTALEVGEDVYVIASGGVLSWSVKTEECAVSSFLSDDFVSRMLRKFEKEYPELPLAIEFATGFVAKTEFWQALKEIFPAKAHAAFMSVSTIPGEMTVMSELFEEYSASGISACRILCCRKGDRDTDDLLEIGERLVSSDTDEFGTNFQSVTTGFPQSFEIKPKNSDKADALARLCHLLGCPSSRVAAFGDAKNDLGMIKWAGYGVAVGNASESLKAAADYVCELTNDQDAVGVEIEKVLEASNPVLAMQENLKRADIHSANLNAAKKQLEKDNKALMNAVDKYEDFVKMITVRSPKPVHIQPKFR